MKKAHRETQTLRARWL